MSGEWVDSRDLRDSDERLRKAEAERDQLREDLAQKDEAIGYIRDRLNHTEVPPLRRERDRYRAALEKAEEHMRYGRPTQAVIVITRALDPTEAPRST